MISWLTIEFLKISNIGYYSSENFKEILSVLFFVSL